MPLSVIASSNWALHNLLNKFSDQTAWTVLLGTVALIALFFLIVHGKLIWRRWRFGPERTTFEKVWAEKIEPYCNSNDVKVLGRVVLEGEALLDQVLQACGFKNKSFNARLEAAERAYQGGMHRAEFFQTVAEHVRDKKTLPVQRLQSAMKDCRILLNNLGLKI